jgi:hypothetical protein
MPNLAARRVSNRSKFGPRQVSALKGWLRLADSTQSGGEWTSIVDVLNPGSPMVQTDVDRRAAVGASANGLPTMVFDATDVHLWPVSPAHSSTTKVGIWLWYKPATIVGTQFLYNVQNAVAGSATRRLAIFQNGATLQFTAYLDNFNGRSGATGAILSAGVFAAHYFQYDSSRGGDANIAIFSGGVAQSLAYSNDGAGGVLGALQAASGSAVIGGSTDSDTPSNPIANGGQLGPNGYAFDDNLTAQQIANFLAFEAPT